MTSRSTMTIDGKPATGNLTLTFLERGKQSVLAHIPTAFEHVSNLTDNLIPVWLTWVFALLTLVCIPLGIVAALRRAVLEDDGAG
jgi:hypothetical protein